MKNRLLLTCAMLCLPSLVLAQPPGVVGLYVDNCNSTCFALDDTPGLVIVNVVHKRTPGATGVEFRVQPSPGFGMFYIADLPPYLVIGNSQTGVSVGYGSCLASDILVMQIFYLGVGLSSPCSRLSLAGRPESPYPGAVTVADCDLELHFVEGGELVFNPNRFCLQCDFPDPDVQIDIRPAECPNPLNVKSLGDVSEDRKDRFEPSAAAPQGVLPVAILGASDFDVQTIDAATVTLEGVPATQIAYEDVADHAFRIDCECQEEGPDGFMDLVLKFRQSDVGEAIGPGFSVGQVVPLVLEGQLLDGCRFRSWDCVKIVGPPQREQAGSQEAELSTPFPNPFNPTSRIVYSLPSAGSVRLAVYDVSGRLVDLLEDGPREAGSHEIEWNAGALPSGVYFFRLESGESVIVRRATLLK